MRRAICSATSTSFTCQASSLSLCANSMLTASLRCAASNGVGAALGDIHDAGGDGSAATRCRYDGGTAPGASACPNCGEEAASNDADGGTSGRSSRSWGGTTRTTGGTRPSSIVARALLTGGEVAVLWRPPIQRCRVSPRAAATWTVSPRDHAAPDVRDAAGSSRCC